MNKTFIAVLTAVPFLLTSCIQDEKENTECDIESISLHIDNPTDFFYHDYDTLQTLTWSDTLFTFPLIKSYSDIQNVPTTLNISEGATAYLTTKDGVEEPFRNGSLVDFSGEKTRWFRVVSQDKMWSRSYGFSIVHDKPSEGNLIFDFEDYFLDPSGKYYIWSAPDLFTDGVWKNGNPGFKISKSSAKPMDYPSTPIVGEGPDGSTCVKLETCDTGPFGKMANMRIASGSMFNGIFDVANAMKNPLKATQFGSPFTHKPVQLRLWLRYEPGSVYQDRDGNPMSGIVDEPDVYIVFYRNEDASGNKVQPDGYDMLTNPYIVAKGRLPHRCDANGVDQLCAEPIHGLTSQWQEVTIPIEYFTEIDTEILKNKGYGFFISIASSWKGGDFMGAIGSKLYLDNMYLFCE